MAAPHRDHRRDLSRRDFVRKVAVGGGAMAVLGRLHIAHSLAGEGGRVRAVLVDHDACAGCRTCEAVCAAANHRQLVEGGSLPGLGNPSLANIRVHHYNPDVDVPTTCALCLDAPCVAACPVGEDPATGRKALYRHAETQAITNDPERCIGCGRCAEACATGRTGTISPNQETGRPERICTLCGGDPQCVRQCPFGALSFAEVDPNRELHALPPIAAAAVLTQRYYDMPLPTGVPAGESDGALPQGTMLLPAYPNPANATVCIPFALEREESVVIQIRSGLGQLVRELDVGSRQAGRHQVYWDGRTEGGARAASAVYFCSMHAGAYTASRSFTMLK